MSSGQFTTSSALQVGPWLKRIIWNEQGLVPVIAQEASSGDVLMMAWMNQDALLRTLQTGQAVYWSRSRNKLWHKGEESGHTQTVREIRLDCDGDTIDRKSTRLNSSHVSESRMPSSA